MTASVVTDEDEDSTDSFRWDDDENGVTFDEAFKPKASVSSYPPSTSTLSCCRVSLDDGLTCSVTQSADDIVLPPILVQSLLKAIPTTCSGTSSRFVVTDTGATDHMVPDRGAFISYKSIQGLHVRMGNNSFAPVLGWGTAIISLNVSIFSSAMSSMFPAFGFPSTVSGRIFTSPVAGSWGATILACMCTSRVWS